MPIRGSPNGARHTPPQAGRDRPEWVVAVARCAHAGAISPYAQDAPDIRNARETPAGERVSRWNHLLRLDIEFLDQGAVAIIILAHERCHRLRRRVGIGRGRHLKEQVL